MLVSFDVVSLFTKVPVAEAVDVVCQKLSDDETLFERTELSVDSIRRLMLACLECRYFIFQGEYYEQVEGAPMGLSLSVVLANAFMESLEDRIMSLAPLKPSYWRRYVDDTFVIWSHGEAALDEFMRFMNSLCPSIQFTVEKETNGQLSFLDVGVSRNDTGGLSTAVYRKPTASDTYIRNSSNHAAAVKVGVIRNLARRAEKIFSSKEAETKEKDYLKTIFKQHGYSKHIIEKGLAKKTQQKDSTATSEETNRITYISLPYVKGLSEPIARILQKHNVKTGHKSKTLRNHLVNVKDKVCPEMQKGAVYQIKCECGESYIGESGRPK